MDENKCMACHIICSAEDAREGKCIVIGDKKICNKCAGHVKATVESSGVN